VKNKAIWGKAYCHTCDRTWTALNAEGIAAVHAKQKQHYVTFEALVVGSFGIPPETDNDRV
jgi:hypothetical protein